MDRGSQVELVSRFGWVAAALILALRGMQQEEVAPEPAADPPVARPTAAALLQP